MNISELILKLISLQRQYGNRTCVLISGDRYTPTTDVDFRDGFAVIFPQIVVTHFAGSPRFYCKKCDGKNNNV